MKAIALTTRKSRPAPLTATAYPLICIALTMAVLTQGAVARAEQEVLDAALATYGRGELDQALEGFEAALQIGDNSADQLIAIHIHLGILRGAGSDLESARRSFEVALALNPMLPTPDELGGQLRNDFEDLRSARSGRRLMVEVRPEANAAIEVAAANAPPGLVSTLGLRATDPGGGTELWTRSVDGAGPTTVALPAVLWQASDRTIVSLVVDALDVHGNLLARGEEELQRSIETPDGNDDVNGVGNQDPNAGVGGDGNSDGPPAEGRRRRWEWWQHPALWVVVGALVVGGVTAGVVLGTRDDDTGNSNYVLGAPVVQ